MKRLIQIIVNLGLKTFLQFTIMYEISFEGLKILNKTPNCAHVHDFVHDLWRKYQEKHVSSLWCTHAPKVPVKHTKKLCTRISNFFSPWITFVLTSGFHWYEHVFETFLGENYAIALGSCYLFTKKMLNMELNIILIVLITEFPYIRHSWNL